MNTLQEDSNVITAGDVKTHQPESHVHHTVLPDGTFPSEPDMLWPSFDRRVVTTFLGRFNRRELILGAIGIVLVLAGTIALVKGLSKPAAPAMAMPPTPVIVQTVVQKPVRLWSEFSGRMQAVNYAEIRPEVGGRITEVRFTDGQTVEKGDVLFVIDPTPYKAALDKAQANSAFAKTELDRADNLVKAQAIAQRVSDERTNASLVADADLSRAQIDYSHAYVKAPISGRVGRPEITEGNLVEPGPTAPLLTSIVSNGGIYADFDVDEQTYLLSVRDHATGTEQEQKIPVELTVQGDKARTYKGTIYSFDNHIDTVSGTIRARAKFPNKDGVLVPGMFVTVKIGSSGEVPVVLVPEQAVSVDQNKKFVYVVGSDNKVVYREVTLGKQLDTDRVVTTGLQPGDRVIVDGIQHVRPDMIVDPKELAPVAAAPVTPPATDADADSN